LSVAAVLDENRQDVCDADRLNVLFLALRGVFFGNVVAELALSFSNLRFKASCEDVAAPVAYDLGGVVGDVASAVAPCSSELKSGAFV
jgi:hypothetical protein